jgi:hypothetical protein
MINFEISESPDNNVISTFKYFQNQIYLGRSNGDLWIDDHDLNPSHLMLEVINKELLIHPQKGVEFFLINGKRATAIRKLKPKDEVTVGKTVIKILDFDETSRQSKKEILNNKLNQLVQENSSRLNVVERLTKLIKQ